MHRVQGQHIPWVQQGPWLGQDDAGALCSQELPGCPLINNELLKFTPSFSCHPLNLIVLFFKIWQFPWLSFLLVFCLWFSQSLPPANFPMSYFTSSGHFLQRSFLPDVLYSGILICWPGICFMSLPLIYDFFAIASIFLLLLPFPSA